MFMWSCRLYFIIIRSQKLLGTILRLCEKHTPIVCYIESGLNRIFHIYTHWLFSFKSLFSSISEWVLFIAWKKRYVSSANVLHSEVTPSGKSFIYIRNIRNNNGPKTAPFRISDEMSYYRDICQFKTTGCRHRFLSLENILSNFTKLPSMQYVCSFKSKPLCLALSNVSCLQMERCIQEWTK